jgi:hypothetical protein
MKKIAFVFVFTFINSGLYALQQIPDRLIVQEDTFELKIFPLESYFSNMNIFRIDTIFSSINEACERGAICDWKIASLFLIRIKDCCSLKEIPLEKIFPISQIRNNKVFAFWFSDHLMYDDGDLLVEARYANRYKRMYQFSAYLKIENGILKESKSYDNRKDVEQTTYTNTDFFEYMIYSQLDWNKFPDIEIEIYLNVDCNAYFNVSMNADLEEIETEIKKAVLSVEKWESLAIIEKGKIITEYKVIEIDSNCINYFQRERSKISKNKIVDLFPIDDERTNAVDNNYGEIYCYS